MSLLTKPENSTTATTPLRKPDSLRIRQCEGDAARVVPLSDGKMTIGSSPQCTIVLPASECRPLQCVISLDAHRAEATRWGAGVQLNRRDFTKSIVGVGDKLNIGCCELEFSAAEVVAPKQSELQQPKTAVAAEPIQPPVAKLEAAPQPEPAALQPPTPAAVPLASAPVRTEVKLLPAPPAPASLAVEPKASLPIAESAAATEASPEPAVEQAPNVHAAALPKAITIPVLSSPTLVALVAPLAPPAPQLPSAPAPTATAATETPVTTPAVEAPKTASPAAEPQATSSHQFADELVLQLWQTGDSSRRRARSLVAAARDARLRADAMNDDLSAMEVELDLARAAYDSHAANHEKLHLEIIERDRQAAERLAPLVNEVESLRSQLQESQIELAEQAARCDELSATLDVQAADKAATDAQAAEAHRARELEQSLAVQIEQATLLAHELGAVRTELESVRNELEQRFARQQELESELAGAREQHESLQHAAGQLADCEATIAHLRGEVEGLHGEREELHGKLADSEIELHRLAEMYLAHSSQAVVEDQHASVAEEHAALTEPADQLPESKPEVSAELPESHEFADHQEFPTHEAEPEYAPVAEESFDHSAWPAATPLDLELDAEPYAESHAEIEPTPSVFAPLAPFPLVAEPTPEPAPAEEESHEAAAFAPPPEVKTMPVESEVATSSFIDKYRHLLDDEPSEPTPASLASPLGASRPMLDDEFLSPAKAAERTAHADDSDEALEAYMANMMARMRGVSASSMVEPALPEPVVELPVVEEALTYDPSVPFEIESMKQGRRAPISTDLAALREIANTSARTAIATHRNRRKVESAIGKIVIAIAAFGASGFLMSSAPSLTGWQFGAGVAVAIIGCGAAALAVRGRSDVDHLVDSHRAYFAPDESAHGDA
ncbi:hypothetical protein [Lacipirellula sp.]|uniref:FHA domain-containing protein n=1 Tax=Lacipirellula sp. TaxID=2691419 RepID=UPI003D12A50D